MKKGFTEYLRSLIAALVFVCLLITLGVIHPPIGLVSFPIAMFTLIGSLGLPNKHKAEATLIMNPYAKSNVKARNPRA